MVNILFVLSEATFINHVNFSGMNLGETQVFELMEVINKCPFMLGIHLTDNDITRKPYFNEIIN